MVIIKGHGTVAIGKNFQEAFCSPICSKRRCTANFSKSGSRNSAAPPTERQKADKVRCKRRKSYAIFPRSTCRHWSTAPTRIRNFVPWRRNQSHDIADAFTRRKGKSLDGEICRRRDHRAQSGDGGEFLIGGQSRVVERGVQQPDRRVSATQQGKLQLKRGELAQLSRWYKPFQRAFAIWQTIPVQ